MEEEVVVQDSTEVKLPSGMLGGGLWEEPML
jgi:hypothetical protein